MEMTDSNTFSTLLRRHRAEAGLTQEELAELAGVSARVVSDLERGVTKTPQRGTLQQLADALRLSAEDRARFQECGRRRPRPTPVRSGPDVVGAQGSGIQTFLIADIRGYSRFTRERGDEAAARLAKRFASITDEVATASGGEVLELRGDEALVIFGSARQALGAAVALQGRFALETEGNASLPLPVGIGLDAGEAVPVDRGYRGRALNLAARLCSLAGEGEILASEGLIHLAGTVEGLTYVVKESAQVKGYADPVRIIQVLGKGKGVESVDTSRVRSTHGALPVGGFLGALPVDALVERQQELARIRDAADAVARGSGALMLLTGQPGVGKTRLAQEAMLDLQHRGFVVASGRCYEPQQTVPYYPFLEAFNAVYEDSPAEVRAQTPQRWPYLAYLLPDLVTQPPASAVGSQDVQRLFRSVGGFLIALAETRPVAILLDDLHWADYASLDMLQHLARSTRASPVLLLGTCRQDEVGPQHHLTRSLLALNREGLLEQLPVQPLDVAGTTALIAATFGEESPSPEFCALVHRQTEGNPFFTREVLRTLVERGKLYQENGRWQRANLDDIEVPQSVRAVVAERASRLSERAQEVVHEASVLGHTFVFDDLQAMSDRAEEEIEAALEEAVAAGMVRDTSGDEYTFNHVLTQHALYAELPGRKKRRFHLAAGEALEQRLEGRNAASLSDVIRHLVRGGRPDRALPYAMRAGDAARRVFAHEDAERTYQMALVLARELGHREYLAEALEKLGDTLVFVGRYDAALEQLDEAVEVYRSVGDPNGEGRVEASIGMAHFGIGAASEGIARLQPHIQAFKDRVSVDVRCAFYQAESMLYFGTNSYLDLLESAERWVESAREHGDKGMLALAHGRHGTALIMLGRMDAAIAALDEGLSLSEEAGDRYASMFILHDLAEAYHWAGALDKAMVLRGRCLEVTEELGHRDGFALALCGLAQTLLLLGEWKRAAQLLDEAFDIPSKDSWYAAIPSLTLADLCLLEGDHDAARRHATEGQKFAERHGDLQQIRCGQLTLASLHLAAGKPKDAVAMLVPFLDRDGLKEQNVTLMLPVLAEAKLDLAMDPAGLQQVEVTVQEALGRATAHSCRVLYVRVLRVQGMLLVQQGRQERAQDTFAKAVSMARSISLPYEEACVLYEWGLMHADEGDSSSARRRLEQALRIFQGLGARFHIEQTQQALAEWQRERST